MSADASRGSVLVVDDEPTIGEVVCRYLQRAGYETHVALDGVEAVEMAAARGPDLVVLDLMLPRVDGLEAMRRIRALGGRRTPIILLTARGEESDRIIGLRLGADDYIVKPFSPAELVARVDAVLRRIDTVPRPAARRCASTGSSWIRADGACSSTTSRSCSPSASSTCCCSSPATRARRSRATSSWTTCGVTRSTRTPPRSPSTSAACGPSSRRRPERPRWIETVWGIGYRFAA